MILPPVWIAALMAALSAVTVFDIAIRRDNRDLLSLGVLAVGAALVGFSG